jgi:hypothetical protein
MKPDPHTTAVATYPNWLLEAVIRDMGERNLRNQRDHEVRWCAERSSAARAERRKREAALS